MRRWSRSPFVGPGEGVGHVLPSELRQPSLHIWQIEQAQEIVGKQPKRYEEIDQRGASKGEAQYREGKRGLDDGDGCGGGAGVPPGHSG